MSFQNKGFWMGKVADGNSRFDNPSRIEPKRPHQWFVDAAQPELFPNKKQALETPTTASSSGILNINVSSWNNISSFQSVSNQLTHHLFGPARTCSANFSEQTICPETDDSNASISLSTSHTMDDPEGLSYGGLRKVKVNQVKDLDDNMLDLKGHGFSGNIPSDQAFNGENESSFMSIGQAYDKEDNTITLMGHNYHGESHIVSANPTSVSEVYGKEETNMISFGGFHNPHDIMPVGRLIGSYDQFYEQSSLHTADAVQEKEVDASNANVASKNTRVTNSKPESVSRNKSEVKSGRKEASNSFPSNVRSLISTGMLDGVPVKYVASSRQELRGIIKGSGYLCGCESCYFSKVLNAYEFERHAGCKTKHPNNHIYFENGKTIYQIVQELRNTPETMLFDVIQTVFGAPINQKSFRIWKESFQAATRELQRIYGKEELNL